MENLFEIPNGAVCEVYLNSKVTFENMIYVGANEEKTILFFKAYNGMRVVGFPIVNILSFWFEVR